MSRMYASGSLRSWIHYTELRCDEATQTEHREVADGIRAILAEHMPATFSAAKSLSHEKACIMTVTPMCCAPCVECGGTLPATETSGPRRPGAISRSTARPAAARRCSACSSWWPTRGRLLWALPRSGGASRGWTGIYWGSPWPEAALELGTRLRCDVMRLGLW